MNLCFNQRIPHLLVVDDFYKNPKEVIKQANELEFIEDLRYYKGKRSTKGLLFPYVKEEFEHLLSIKITDWITQPMNGIFQKTNKDHPLVYHSDTQNFAAAIYLTEGADDVGTSFWRDKTHRCRRPPNHFLENKPAELCSEVYSEYNITHPDNWELVDKVGSVFNRLVIWDAKLIHSASKYSENERLVQLFFFSAGK